MHTHTHTHTHTHIHTQLHYHTYISISFRPLRLWSFHFHLFWFGLYFFLDSVVSRPVFPPVFLRSSPAYFFPPHLSRISSLALPCSQCFSQLISCFLSLTSPLLVPPHMCFSTSVHPLDSLVCISVMSSVEFLSSCLLCLPVPAGSLDECSSTELHVCRLLGFSPPSSISARHFSPVFKLLILKKIDLARLPVYSAAWIPE